MKWVLFILLQVGFCLSHAINVNTQKVFRSYLSRAKHYYEASEKRLFKVGDRHLEKHAEAAERLSLAEMLPQNKNALKSFCRTYPKQIANYYNLNSVKNIKDIKSPIFKEYYRMVNRECSSK